MTKIKSFLSSIDPLELQQKIRDFRALNIRKMSYIEISNAISNVITFEEKDGGRHSIIPSQICTYPASTKFYRIRTIDAGDTKIPLKSMSHEGDCWEPPAEVVGIGRLNKENEPLLYTTPSDHSIALEEMKISDNENFSLIIYESIGEVKVSVIGAAPVVNEGLNNNEKLNLALLQDFLHDEFTRDVGKGTEYLYKISESIAKDYFDFPDEIQDAWCYPSVAKKEGYNVCFKPKKKKILRFVGVQICSSIKHEDSYQVTVKLVGKINDYSGSLEFYEIGSDGQKEIFPELKVNCVK